MSVVSYYFVLKIKTPIRALVNISLLFFSILFSLHSTPYFEDISHSFVHQQGIVHTHQHQSFPTEQHSTQNHQQAFIKVPVILSAAFSTVIQTRTILMVAHMPFIHSELFLAQSFLAGFSIEPPPQLSASEQFCLSYPNKAPPVV